MKSDFLFHKLSKKITLWAVIFTIIVSQRQNFLAKFVKILDYTVHSV